MEESTDRARLEKFAEVIGEWQRRLLQLDRRNNILYFKTGGRTSVGIPDHTADRIKDALLSSRRGLTFDYVEPRRRTRADPLSQDSLEEDRSLKSRIIPGDLSGDCPPDDLQRRLGNLRRRAREWQEEQGLNVLFLALGFLRWTDEENQQVVSPLLLLPCRLERASPRDAFTLWQEDEDLTTNLTLSVKLSEYGIELPEADSGMETPIEYLDAVRDLVARHTDWEVDDAVYLSTFAYSKLAMWRDLQIIRENGTDHQIILTLAGGSIPVEPDDAPSILPLSIPDDLAGGRLDDVLDVHDQFAVLPADYSQLLAISAARSGSNLVVHGPPGTGKSQTIANIIATFMAEGKSVLFVSEKTAALDIVKRRLDETGLGSFCLDLHGRRASKARIYEQLRESVNDRRSVARLDFDYVSLTERRRQLNHMVRALHQMRQPFGRTVFQVQGRFALIKDVPHVPFDVGNLETLDRERFERIRGVCDRVRLRRREFNEHWTSRWRVLKSRTPSLELADVIRQDMRILTESIERMQAVMPEFFEVLGLTFPETLNEVIRLEMVARHLAEAPGVPRNWLQDDVAAHLTSIVEREARLQDERSILVDRLIGAFGDPIPDWDFSDLSEKLTVTPEEERSLKRLLGEQWSVRFVQGDQAVSEVLQQVESALARLRSVGDEIAGFLKLKSPSTWTELLQFLGIVRTLSQVTPVPQTWVEPSGMEVGSQIVAKAKDLSQALDKLERQLFSEFDTSITEVVNHDMVARFRTNHQSLLRRILGSGYRADRRLLQSFRRKPGKLTYSEQLRFVEEITELQGLRTAWGDLEKELALLLQDRFTGRNTDWDTVTQDMRDVRDLVTAPSVDRVYLSALLTQSEVAIRSRELSLQLEQSTLEASNVISSLLDSDMFSQIQEGLMVLSSLDDTIRTTRMAASQIEAATTVVRASVQEEIATLGHLKDLLDLGTRLVSLERDHLQLEDALAEEFGARFRGFDTDWVDIQACLDWTENLLSILPQSEHRPRFIGQVEKPLPSSLYLDVGDSIGGVIRQFKAQTYFLDEGYDLSECPWESWEEAKFADMRRWSEELSSDADSASDWLQYQAAIAELDSSVGPLTAERIRQATDDSELVPRIVERRVLGSWLDWVYDQEPVLASFNTSDQQDLIAKFRQLDQQLSVAAQNEVRKKVLQRYPSMHATGSELGILRGELSKKRRQWPVRRLLRTIPRLIQTLKPCFFVSPLAVSQYLPLTAEASTTLIFDAVIFDEASQVFPEDAVPAILRGNQLILAGDQKQLPPSNFWRRSMDEDETELDDEADDSQPNQLEGRESILDAAVGQVGKLFNEEHLNVHYRSRDESLIRFSNHHFYGNRLLTFPSPGARHSWYGVHDVYVPDGRYDAGATRANRKEADKVVDLVFEHMRTRPAIESLGVVALSRPQADLINRLIEERRILERDVDERFNEDSEEPFFVKNLENVQGDERDRMIISIGYGPTVGSGVVPNRFGPINVAGGERRLNVVITRAKQRVDLVHSLRASDIRSQQTGSRFLRRYLEYASNPTAAFEGEVTIDNSAEVESPFEDAVKQALVAKGYRVISQVGVSGYRIDLAIMSEDGLECDLGIECDGWFYHSSPAARDRDWLRQKVLEGLGWTIHRVWSTAWVRNPTTEMARIEEALDRARAQADSLTTTIQIAPDSVEQPSEHDGSDATVGTTEVELTASPSGSIILNEYLQTVFPPPRYLAELKYATTETLIQLITKIAEVEGPVHNDVVIERIRQHYGIGKVKGSTRDKVERAIVIARRGDSVLGDGTFVWLQEEQLHRKLRRPPDRNIEHIPPTELRAIVAAVTGALFGSGRKTLITEVARTLGFNRSGGRITEVLDKALQGLLNEGELVESFDMIHVTA